MSRAIGMPNQKASMSTVLRELFHKHLQGFVEWQERGGVGRDGGGDASTASEAEDQQAREDGQGVVHFLLIGFPFVRSRFRRAPWCHVRATVLPCELPAAGDYAEEA